MLLEKRLNTSQLYNIFQYTDLLIQRRHNMEQVYFQMKEFSKGSDG